VLGGGPETAPVADPVTDGLESPAGSVDHAPVSGGLDATALRRSWDAVLDDANGRKRATKALLLNAQILELSGRSLTLAFSTAALSRQFQSSTNIDVLKESLQAVLGLDVDLTLVVAGEAPAASAPAPSEPAGAPAPSYEGFAPGDEIEPEDPDTPQPDRQVAGEDAALKLVADQLGGTVMGTHEP
jgi:DNA polymerase-3 subunit gamma/tau